MVFSLPDCLVRHRLTTRSSDGAAGHIGEAVVDADHWLPVTDALNSAINVTLSAQGIQIPFPQRVVRLGSSAGSSVASGPEEAAQEARTAFASMQRKHLVEFEDSVVAYKNKNGNVKLDQTVGLAVIGAASGVFWALLIGLTFTIPFGGLLVPNVVGVFVASIGALSGKMSDYGIDDAMIKELSHGLDEGKAALFVLMRKATIDKVLEKLQSFHGKVLQTSLSHELDDKQEQMLDKSAKAA